jgi:hypothetical protein
MKHKHDKDTGLIPTDLKDHVVKTVITLALGGLGALMVASGSFLLNEQSRLQKFSAYKTTANEIVAKYARRHEFADAVRAGVKRTQKRFIELNKYLDSSKGHLSPEKLRERAAASSQEVADDLGLLAGFTPDTTGLPTSFHENVRGFFSMELDFWRVLDDASAELQRNPKTIPAKLYEIHDRLTSLLYASSLLVSSLEDTAEAVHSQAERNKALADAIQTEAQHEAMLIWIAWNVFIYSALLFILIAILMLLDRLQMTVRKLFTKDGTA